MNVVRVALAALLLFSTSLSAQFPKKAGSVEEVFARYQELKQKGVILPLPQTPDDFKAAAAKTFDVDAHRFAFTFNPSPFVVNQGDSVTLRLKSSDDGDGFGHGFFLERYVENSLTLPPNQTFTINFVANEPGNFFFFCTVTCGSGHVLMSGTFTVRAVTIVPPSITSIAPTSGSTAGGNNVEITGSGFQPAATVKFGTGTATATVNSETSITAVAPAHAAGPVSITVTNPDNNTATSPQQYTYIVPGPSIASVSPDSGPSAGGTTLTIAGNGFQSGATVKLGSLNAQNVVVNSATSITVTTPLGPTNLAAAGEAFDVIVINPDAVTATKSGGFRYTVPPPVITSIFPNRGKLAGGTLVTITGAGYTSAVPPAVTFGGVAGTEVLVIDATSFRVRTPAHAEGVVNVVVNVGSASATSTGGFTFANTPPKPRGVKH